MVLVQPSRVEVAAREWQPGRGAGSRRNLKWLIMRGSLRLLWNGPEKGGYITTMKLPDQTQNEQSWGIGDRHMGRLEGPS